MWSLVLLLALGGCDVVFHIDPIATGDGSEPQDTVRAIDAGPCVDGMLVGDYGPMGQGLVQLCVANSAPVMIAGSAINTDIACDSTLPLDNGFDGCVIVGTSVTFDGPTTVTGARPLVIAASEMIAVNLGATIDLSATATKPGPGGDTPNCDAGDGGNSGLKGGGGGGGASWGTSGGAGGASGAAGMPNTPGTLTSVRGGCQGGTGGTGLVTGGDGGHGGGAIYLVAPIVTVDGTIFAEGGGGAGGNANATAGGGGGGGGSGGLIAIDARTFASKGMLSANGGSGGGGGGDSTNGTAGASSRSVTIAAAGGMAGHGASSGGDGAIHDGKGQAAGPTGSGPGAGGGGGGQGFIVVYSSAPNTEGETSPTLIHD